MEEVGKATSTNEDIAKPAGENNAKLSVLECARRNKSKAKEELNKRQREQQLMMKQREEEEERRQKEAQEQQMREKEEMERQAEEAKKKAEKVKATAAPKISSTTPKPKPMPKSAGNKKKSTAPETQVKVLRSRVIRYNSAKGKEEEGDPDDLPLSLWERKLHSYRRRYEIIPPIFS